LNNLQPRRMRFLRLLHNMTLEELSARIAIDRSDLARIEKGRLRPSQRARERLEAYFGQDVDLLLSQVSTAEFQPMTALTPGKTASDACASPAVLG
jgi:transcriptional regulator with XRE-family HTH domain